MSHYPDGVTQADLDAIDLSAEDEPCAICMAAADEACSDDCTCVHCIPDFWDRVDRWKDGAA